ncbi:MAG: ester cyclase [Pseudomonadota bacterium]
MTDFQAAKAVTRGYMAAFDRAPADQRLAALQAHTTPNYSWRGLHPFHEQDSAESAIDTFWTPFLNAFNAVQRREVIFFAGLNDCDEFESIWTCSMGHFKALFDQPWLGIRPTRKTVMIRYAEFHRIEGDRIAETALFVDILDVIQQAGLWPLPPMTAASFVHPGPLTNDGQLFAAQDPAEGKKTLATINKMASNISKANAILQGKCDAEPLAPHEELSQTWHDDMSWYGPAGIGAVFTIDRYVEQHQEPFRKYLANRVFNGHVARIAEGHYGGFFGWPNLSVTPTGGYMGLPATGQPADMRVVDVYRRDGDKLAENWVFIDMLHFLNQQGLDVLARLKDVSRT